ncbi:MAG: DUF2958 domain-containing protein [Novosphingobium sp.]
MQLITDTIRAELIANGSLSIEHPEFDPQEPDILYGLCDLGLGEPELGTVSLAEIEALRGPLGLPIERDLYFEAA